MANNLNIAIVIYSKHKKQVLKNHTKLFPITETIIFCSLQKLALRGDNQSGPIFGFNNINKDRNFRS